MTFFVKQVKVRTKYVTISLKMNWPLEASLWPFLGNQPEDSRLQESADCLKNPFILSRENIFISLKHVKENFTFTQSNPTSRGEPLAVK